MIDSTARAQRFDGDLSPAPAYLWAPPQKPVSVAIPYPIVDQLERAAVESFRSLTSRGSEIGGLLFGTVEPGSPLLVRIESYEAVDCDYSGGPLYHLTGPELIRLDRLIEQRQASGIRAVGFYRSHTRKGLALNPEDLEVFESRFREPHHIALLIRPAATKASMAGIFIREDGKVRGDSTSLEFPFRSSQQDANKRADALYDGAVAGPRAVAAAPAPPRQASRAQIVPIASRREVAPEPPMPEPIQAAPPPPEAPVPVAAPPPPPVIVVAPAAEPVIAPVASKPAAPAAPKAAAPVTPKAVEPVKPAPEPVEEAVAAAPKERSNKLLWISLGAVVPLVLLVGFFFSSGILHRGKATIPGAGQDTSALALRVDRNGSDIVLTWNRDSEVIKHATRAVLAIADGPQHENVEMDLSQLRNVGSIVYSPVTGDVVFRMEVTGADQTKTTSESVRVLRTRPSPMPETSAQQSPTPGAAETPAGTPAAPAAPAVEEDKPVALAQATKPFNAEPLAQRLRPTAPSELPDAPVLGAPAASASVNLGNIVTTQAAPLPQSSQVSVASTPAPAEKKPATGGQIQQAQLISRRDPEYPKLARNSGASGIVELLATVGADGRVREVKVLKGHPLLRQAAVDAVQKWIYRPTMLNGVAVETQTQVILNFKGDR